ncbi:TlpA family protein disulfide reductase [Pseudomonadota bacterium]
MNYKKIILASWIACLSLLIVGQAAASNFSHPAPDFTLKSRSGENIKLSELRGQVVMLNFWASWCGPCRQEMPILEKLYQRYNQVGFTILGINVEADSNEALHWLKNMDVTFPILLDTMNKTSELYSVMAMPTTLLIDRDGNIRYMHKGYIPGVEDEYQQQIRALIKE